ETGISEDPDVRSAVAKRIVERAADHGIPKEDVVVDPLVMPVGAMATAGRQELGVNTTCGASNVSFGLPNRHAMSATFLSMAIASGMTSAITSPLHPEVVQAVMAADVLMGHDPDCSAWIRRFRQPAGGGEPAPEGRRRGGRAARRAEPGP